MCYNGSVYPERNENHSHLGGFWNVYWITHPANQALFPRCVLFWGNCQADVWILKGSKTPDAEIVWFSLSQIPHTHLPESFFFWGASRISAHALRTYIPLSSILFTLFGMWYEVGMCGGIWVFSLVFTRGFGVGKP